MGYVVNWQGDDLHNMLSLPNAELYRLYAHLYTGSKRDRQMNIRSKANKFRRKLNEGKIIMPERSTPYNPETELNNIEARRQSAAMHLAGKALETTVITVPTEHLPYHERLQEALTTEGAVSSARFSDWQSLTKDATGEAQIHDLHGSRFEVKFDSEPRWPVVNRVESRRLERKIRGEQLSLPKTDIISDLQWPFVDLQALDVTCQILRERQPNTLIIGGDLMDLSAWSKYTQRPEWATVTQQSVNEIHQFLASLRKMLPTSRIVVVEGNHEKRMPDVLLNNAKAAYGLKRADQPEGWPVLSIPYLTAMDTLDIEYHDGFPANPLWLNPELQFKHRAKGRGANAVANNERYSTVYGDNHRIESQYKTYPTMDGAKTYGVFGVGCLCRLDGHTPGANTGLHLDGTVAENYSDNWQQGFMLIDHHADGSYSANQVFIDTFNGYKAIYNGKLYEAKNGTVQR